MSGVRVFVGTRKGAFILTSDGARKNWDVTGPHFAGWEIYHLKASPADPNCIYASQTSSGFGQVLQRSNDAGKTWEPVGNKFAYDGTPGTHLWYDGTPHPWEFARVWHTRRCVTRRACGPSGRRSLTPTRFTRVCRMRPYSDRRTARKPGKSCRGCGNI